MTPLLYHSLLLIPHDDENFQYVMVGKVIKSVIVVSA